MLLTVLDALIGVVPDRRRLGFGLLPRCHRRTSRRSGLSLGHPLVAGGGRARARRRARSLGVRAARPPRSWFLAHVEQGGAILRTPTRYVRSVVTLQLAGWACRIGVAFCLLAAFGLPATVPLAVLVVVAGGLSTLVPTPGGAGTQQVLLVYALQQTASTAAALSFSVGMQVGITAVNTVIGLTALMFMFRTLRPVAAVREARRTTSI